MEKLVKEVQDLKTAQALSREQLTKLEAEKELLRKEVERARHMEQVRMTNTVRTDIGQMSGNQSVPQPGTHPGTGEGQKPPRVCWNCGQPGHYARQCPYGPPRGPLTQGPPVQQGYSDQSNLRSAGLHRNGLDIASGACYLSAQIDGVDRECLLDTGSEISVLPAKLVAAEKIQPTNHTLTAVNGTKMPVLGRAIMPFSVPGYSSVVTGLVSHHVTEIILGIDWLEANHAVWNFHQASLQLGNKLLRLKARPKGRKWCRRVVLQENVEVPPRSQVNLPCRIVFHGRPEDVTGYQWGTEPVMIAQGLHAARTLTPTDQLVNVPIRVMNVSCKSQRICTGTVVADLEPLSVVETCDTEGVASDTCAGFVRATEVHAETEASREEDVPEFIRELVDRVDGATRNTGVIGYCTAPAANSQSTSVQPVRM